LPASRLSRLNHYPQFKEQKKMPLLLRVSDIAECSGVIHSPPSSQIKKLQFSQDFSQPFIRPFFTFPTVLAGLAKAYSLTTRPIAGRFCFFPHPDYLFLQLLSRNTSLSKFGRPSSTFYENFIKILSKTITLYSHYS
jgi:hypothetical protein